MGAVVRDGPSVLTYSCFIRNQWKYGLRYTNNQNTKYRLEVGKSPKEDEPHVVCWSEGCTLLHWMGYKGPGGGAWWGSNGHVRKCPGGLLA